MGQLIRSHEWSKTSVGVPDSWPQSLRTTLGLILHSAFPMFLFWGDDLTCFYNDAYRPSLGNNGKHPGILGQPAKESWPESWPFIGPLIDQVLSTGEPVWFEDQLVPIFRNGQLEDVYWTFSYSPAYGDNGQVGGVLVTCTETTDKVNLFKRLQKSEQYFHELTDTVPAIIWETRPDGYCTHLNKQWYETTGQTEEEAEGYGWLNATHPDDQEEAGRLFLEANSQRAPFSIFYRLRQKDGTYRWSIDRGNPQYGPDGDYIGMVGTVTDVHEKQLAEQEQREKTELLQAVFDSTLAGLSVLHSVRDEAGLIVDFEYQLVNRMAQQIDNRTDLVGQRCLAMHPHFVDSGLFDDFRNVVETGQPMERDRHYLIDGITSWFATVAVKNDDGVVYSFRDITAERTARQQISESEERFRTMAEDSEMLIAMSNEVGQTVYLNHAWTDLTGRSIPDLVDRGWVDLVHPDDRDAFLALYASALKKQVSFSGEFRMLSQHGDYRWLLVNCPARFRPGLDGADATFAGYISSALDITDRKQAEEAIRQSREQQSFMLQLSDQIRSLSDPTEIQYQAAYALGKQVGANRVGYAEDGRDGQSIIVTSNYTDGVASIEGRYRYEDYGASLLAELQTGRTVVRPDIANDPTLTAAEKEAHTILKMGATLNKPLLKGGQLEAVFFLHFEEPHYFTPLELNLLEETAERIWEAVSRASAEVALRASEARFRSLIQEAPIATMLLTGPDYIVEVANDGMVDLLGKGPFIIGKPAVEAVPELAAQDYLGLLNKVYTSGETYQEKAMPGQLVKNGVVSNHYFDFTYKPMRTSEGEIYGILCMTADVTHQVMARLKLAESEAKLRSVVETAPVAIGLFMGRDLIIELPNQTFIDIVGKGPDITGKPLREVMPELITENQGFLQILDDVYTSGKPFHSYGSLVQIVQHGVMTYNYYNITYTPLFNEAGEVYAILDIAVDVTGQIKVQEELAQQKAYLQNALDIADLGTYLVDVNTDTGSYTENIQEWLGLDSLSKPMANVFAAIHPDDRSGVEAAISATLHSEDQSRHDITYRVGHDDEQSTQYVRSIGKALYTNGKPYAISGIIQNVTPQIQAQRQIEESATRYRNLAEELDNRVQQRTQELQLANQDLKRSNENLQQFAYIASHDLQEPLRKIQSFSDMLKNQYAEQLGDGTAYLQRMQTAASRMSTLIKDLLSFSRISTQQEATSSVPLNDVVQLVLNTLELIIAETKTQLLVESLPTVHGDASQLGQLFQNLLSNALKFRREGVTPIIQINTRRLADSALPESVRPARKVPFYHQINVSDNGIGFDQKFVDRIFQVFQRLHGKNEFDGTGIGLAICEKVAANHGGAITATSQQGQGATFSVYLPDYD